MCDVAGPLMQPEAQNGEANFLEDRDLSLPSRNQVEHINKPPKQLQLLVCSDLLPWSRHHGDLFVEVFPEYLNLVPWQNWSISLQLQLLDGGCQVTQCLQPQAPKEDRKLALQLGRTTTSFFVPVMAKLFVLLEDVTVAGHQFFCPTKNLTLRRIICDILEHMGQRVTSSWPQFVPKLIEDGTLRFHCYDYGNSCDIL